MLVLSVFEDFVIFQPGVFTFGGFVSTEETLCLLLKYFGVTLSI